MMSMEIRGIKSQYPERYDAGKTEQNMAENGLESQKDDVQKHFRHTAAASVEISEDGRTLLREMAAFGPETDTINAKELSIQNTNEVAWEHYKAMMDMSSQTLKDGDYDVEDVMKSMIDTYETRYHEIVKGHDNGDREVSYGLTGKSSLTLEEDLAGLEDAFKMRLANLTGYITCQQTNKAFENPDSSWYFNRNGAQNAKKEQDQAQYLDRQNQDAAVSIMEQAKEQFLTAYGSTGYKKGTAVHILADILNNG